MPEDVILPYPTGENKGFSAANPSLRNIDNEAVARRARLAPVPIKSITLENKGVDFWTLTESPLIIET